MDVVIETDNRGNVVLPGDRRSQRFTVKEIEGGGLLLMPEATVSSMQQEYDTDPDLQEDLSSAMKSPTVRATWRTRTGESVDGNFSRSRDLEMAYESDQDIFFRMLNLTQRVLQSPESAQRLSTVVTTTNGPLLFFPGPSGTGLFWTADPVRIELLWGF